ncbi:hypothetical protein AKG39_06565 [Acetobacterium bakii]|uniref:TraG P-loop domain-containing protein n=2 Tax=Acetobacterium bakii TaxID=52689 RepID=A0A0L6U1S5_9FIRM|nr:hypothetical protein AKG39_06565 [Acetobacterium bakii]
MNIISPVNMEIKPNELWIGEYLARVYGVIQYPPHRDYGWLGRLSNIPGTVFSIEFDKIDNADFINDLNRSVNQHREKAYAAKNKDTLAELNATKREEDSIKMLKQIEFDQEVVGNVGISVMPMANDREVFTKMCHKVQSTFLMEKTKIRSFPYLQKEGFRNLFPACTQEKDVRQIIKTVMPLSSVLGGFPFASCGYNDQEGFLYGRDSTGGRVILNLWKRGKDRTNSSVVVLGDVGSGKSTVIKNMALMEYAMGTRIIFIDPEREYQDLCRNLGGDWINAGGDGKHLINPLQILPLEEDMYQEKDNEKERDLEMVNDAPKDKRKFGAMALHLKTLDVFFNLYFKDITDIQKALLKDAVITLYNRFNIFWDTDVTTLKNTAFPTFKELYELLMEKEASEYEKGASEKAYMDYRDLAIIFKDLAIGGDSFLWSGYTSLRSDARCVCLDTFDLNNSSDTIKSTQYFNLLSWAWQEMSRDRHERILLVCDESYLMIDERVPQSLVFLRNAMKRCRKYEAGIMIISHAVEDFLNPSIKMYGQALLDQPCYKIMLGTTGQNLHDLKKLYNLTEAEQEVLTAKLRGKGLFIIGRDRISMSFDVADYKFKYFGDRGGR